MWKYFQAIVMLVVLFSYIWVITAGTTTWISPGYNKYYDMLADSFIHGKTYLLLEPSKELLLLPDPYKLENRTGINFLWDVSLFNSKYYLYWGATPAIIALPLKVVFHFVVRTEYLVLFFLIGAFLWQVLIILSIWKRFFNGYYSWTIPFASLAIGFGNPIFWILHRPSVYETAICGGQFFLLLAYYFSFLLLIKQGSPFWYSFGAGLCYSLAIGSRFNLFPLIIFSVGGLLLFHILNIIRNQEKVALIFPIFLGISIPLILCVGLLLFYNMNRFNNPLEFGIRYQLTGMDMRSPTYWNLNYSLPNLYNYLLRPPIFRSRFPFVFSPMIDYESWPQYIKLPQYYYSREPVSGIVLTTPLTWFALLGCGIAILRRKMIIIETPKGNADILKWIILWLCGNILLSFCPILLYFFSSMRFEYDFIPSINLLAVLGLWYSLFIFRQNLIRMGLGVVFVLIALYTIPVGFLIGFSEYHEYFRKANDPLFMVIRDFSMQGYDYFSNHFLFIYNYLINHFH